MKVLTATKKIITTTARIAVAEEVIYTVIDGVTETNKVAKKGDFVLTGPKGEEYTMDPNAFNGRYNIIAEAGPVLTVQTKPVGIKFIYAMQDLDFTASWGEKMIAKKGDILVQEEGQTSYRIEKEIFSQTYDID